MRRPRPQRPRSHLAEHDYELRLVAGTYSGAVNAAIIATQYQQRGLEGSAALARGLHGQQAVRQ